MPNWSAKLEYLYYDLGTVTLNSVVTWGAYGLASGELWYAYSTSASARFNGNLVRAGVNYHFNWGVPVPVLAKY